MYRNHNLFERWLRAEVLEALGRDEEAKLWYESMGFTNMSPDPEFLAPRYLRLGKLYERMGKPKEAEFNYARFIDRWKEADPELQPHVEAARRSMEALSTDR